MITVGSFEAKTQFSSLLRKVELGEEILITRHGRTVAKIVPCGGEEKPDAASLVASIIEISDRSKSGPESWKDLRDLGRKW
jgi:prevent-host-death family protein